MSAFVELGQFYTAIGEVSDAEFRHFVDSESFTAQILMLHFFVIEFIVGSYVLQPVKESFPFKGAILSAWIRDLVHRIPAGYSENIAWLIEVESWIPKSKY